MDSDDFFGSIQGHFKGELPFVVYRKPNEGEIIAILQKDSILHEIVDFSESGFVFAPFDDDEKAILIPNESTKSIKFEGSMSSFSVTSEKSLLKHIEFSEEKRKLHISLVQNAIDRISENEFQKVVVSRNESISLTNSNPIEIFKKLLNAYPTAFVYCWYHPKVGLWLGATPETLMGIEGNQLTTMALAGTQKFIYTENVAWNDKEKKEQQFVTDFIVKSLKSSVEKLQVSETTTLKAGNLLHLKTVIKARLNREALNLKKILQNLHPTPAVCGLPRDSAKQFILDNEGYNRDFYTGFLGELNLKEKKSRNSNRHNVENNAYATIKTISNLYVNLRCTQIKDNQAIIYIGGGITKDSDPEKEWEETVSKSQVIKSIL